MSILSKVLLKTSLVPVSTRLTVVRHHEHHFAYRFREMAGNREQVGFGINGQPFYCDSNNYPFPAVRWRAPSPEVCALFEKQKCDWKALSCEDRKGLYRANFRQTFSEFLCFFPEWKFIIGCVLYGVSAGLWIYILDMIYVMRGDRDLPFTYGDTSRQCQLRRLIDLHMNPITGLTSNWDYEKNDWKTDKKRFWHYLFD